jgi:hypothetical protein
MRDIDTRNEHVAPPFFASVLDGSLWSSSLSDQFNSVDRARCNHWIGV